MVLTHERIYHELGEEYILDDYKIKKDVVVFHISSKCEELVCPYCGEKSNKVHSTYEREIQDLPMQNKKVIVLVKRDSQASLQSLFISP